ncbi:hypothetical protein QQX98_010223 [Neonectria punicea]|uniref:Uncharacterized protein n=1 Tax=Neonectria punicea TaxID=979145 RepID=A0ABR1GQ08_9HYPO
MEVTACFDTVGTMGKSALDVALACDALSTSKDGSNLARSHRLSRWQMSRWASSAFKSMIRNTLSKLEYRQANEELRKNGAKVVDVYLTPPEEYMIGDTNVDDLIDIILKQQGKNRFERYLKTLQVSKVRTLEEIIHFNEDHENVEFHEGYCPDQDGLAGPVKIVKARR